MREVGNSVNVFPRESIGESRGRNISVGKRVLDVFLDIMAIHNLRNGGK